MYNICINFERPVEGPGAERDEPHTRLALIWFTDTRAAAQLRGGARRREQPRWRRGCRTHGSVPRCHLQLAILQVEGCKMPGICELPQGSAPGKYFELD